MIDAAKLADDLKILSADDMEGRAPETRGSAKARAFIIKRFQESGIKTVRHILRTGVQIHTSVKIERISHGRKRGWLYRRRFAF
jgi:hypothetical protein